MLERPTGKRTEKRVGCNDPLDDRPLWMPGKSRLDFSLRSARDALIRNPLPKLTAPLVNAVPLRVDSAMKTAPGIVALPTSAYGSGFPNAPSNQHLPRAEVFPTPQLIHPTLDQPLLGDNCGFGYRPGAQAVETECFPIRTTEWAVHDVHPLAVRYCELVDTVFPRYNFELAVIAGAELMLALNSYADAACHIHEIQMGK